MFYHLLYPLRDIFFGFNVFKYITFRAAGAAVTSFLLCMLLGPFIIERLRELKIGQVVRSPDDAKGIYEMHKNKAGTPTMGGLLIVTAIVLSTLLWGDLTNKYVLLSLMSIIWLCAVGFLDDYMKMKLKVSKGLTARSKFIGQAMLGLMLGLYVYFDPQIGKDLDVPFLKDLVINLGIFYVLFTMLVIVGSSNAVNLTDGLDGLAIGCTVIVVLTYTALSYITGNVKMAEYLNIIHIPGAGELAVFCAAILGAGLGFLWFNSFPANVFMGDTGSLALGGAIGVVATFIKKELLLLVVGGIFVAEALSVIIQVASFRFLKKRIFLMAPIHHHFQMKGWSETKVVIRFWIIGIILALISLSTLKLR
ncbi:MAG TPA: phospho-N-acetylmuramoyl-pentapeptide-transferase [Candidatus Omnitrophota bacterium]|nr:phospho-N-acetylmuramoyl-pentapeptide-transferase [Candidatus Omnitrophota bacterium]HOX09171.1 phospho-N-acetylmuramoyl-pentapeptide-transferase [Candidatus Omnitrophota bacterium]HPN65961.1 phospho-N-acetylmuramoyl-pentapeptide-transferase [Candidatus Omnitrophota bacterium]